MSKKYKSSLAIEKEIKRLKEARKAMRSEELKQAKQFKSKACEFLGSAILDALGVSWDKLNPSIVIENILQNKDIILDIDNSQLRNLLPKEKIKQYRNLKNFGYRPVIASDAERLCETHTAEI